MKRETGTEEAAQPHNQRVDPEREGSSRFGQCEIPFGVALYGSLLSNHRAHAIWLQTAFSRVVSCHEEKDQGESDSN